MTTTDNTIPTAAGSGTNATKAFRASQQQAESGGTSAERVSTVVQAMLDGVHRAIRDEQVTYTEFVAAKQWLIDVGEGGEWPLFLDVFVEHEVEDVAAQSQQGSKGSILGPYYLPDAPKLPAVTELPMREDEQGTSLVFTGQVRDTAGKPVPGAELDVWHADHEGYYSGFAPHIPDGNLRGVVVADEGGHFEIRTVEPAPDRRTDREVDRGRGMAPVAPGSPAPARAGTGIPLDHHAVVFHRRGMARLGRCQGDQTRPDPRPAAAGRRSAAFGVRLRARTRMTPPRPGPTRDPCRARVNHGDKREHRHEPICGSRAIAGVRERAVAPA